MSFFSLDFLLLLPLLFFFYWLISSNHLFWQNFCILLASYIFYGCWDWRLLSLLFISSFIGYISGLLIHASNSTRHKKYILTVSVLSNLGLLGFFKYYNFFIDTFVLLFDFLGVTIHTRSLQIIMPIGISYYVFQVISYAVDVYRDKIKPTKEPVAFFAFVSFFPKIVAGPIERADNLLVQFSKPRLFNYAQVVAGARQILWGAFKKIVIADNLAIIAERSFANPSAYNSPDLVLGVVAFSFQIYCDFSGYSDVAIGVGRLFGFDMVRNFAYPYFSRDIAEFWRRWHISLSSWLKDYLYIPLGGNRGGKLYKMRNILIVFGLCGLWHGANWTFVCWGFLNGLYFLPAIIGDRERKNGDIVAYGRWFPTIWEFVQISFTFVLVTLAWIFFKAENVSKAIEYLSLIVTSFTLHSVFIREYYRIFTLLVGFILIEWFSREKEYALMIPELSWCSRWSIYYLTALVTVYFYFNNQSEVPFIYVQF